MSALTLTCNIAIKAEGYELCEPDDEIGVELLVSHDTPSQLISNAAKSGKIKLVLNISKNKTNKRD